MKKISLETITSIMEVLGAGFIVAGVGVIFGLGACLLSIGAAILALSYLASLGSAVNN